MKPALTAEAVQSLACRCTLGMDDDPRTASFAEGVRDRTGPFPFGLHPTRLTESRPLLVAMIAELPDDFLRRGGGGSSFLNLCGRKDGAQWGEHPDCELLMVLCIASGLARYLLPREQWASLPGGMPYVVFDPDGFPAGGGW